MPEGVEHVWEAGARAIWEIMQEPLMPEGVEHALMLAGFLALVTDAGTSDAGRR